MSIPSIDGTIGADLLLHYSHCPFRGLLVQQLCLSGIIRDLEPSKLFKHIQPHVLSDFCPKFATRSYSQKTSVKAESSLSRAFAVLEAATCWWFQVFIQADLATIPIDEIILVHWMAL